MTIHNFETSNRCPVSSFVDCGIVSHWAVAEWLVSCDLNEVVLWDPRTDRWRVKVEGDRWQIVYRGQRSPDRIEEQELAHIFFQAITQAIDGSHGSALGSQENIKEVMNAFRSIRGTSGIFEPNREKLQSQGSES